MLSVAPERSLARDTVAPSCGRSYHTLETDTTDLRSLFFAITKEENISEMP